MNDIIRDQDDTPLISVDHGLPPGATGYVCTRPRAHDAGRLLARVLAGTVIGAAVLFALCLFGYLLGALIAGVQQ